MSRNLDTHRVPLDQPYAPINELIQDAQTAGKLTALPPWSEQHMLREAITELRRYRAGVAGIQHYYEQNAGLLPKHISPEQLRHVIEFAPYIKGRKPTVPENCIQAAIAVWAITPDRKKNRYTRSSLPMIDEDAIHPLLNELVMEVIYGPDLADTKLSTGMSVIGSQSVAALTVRDAIFFLSKYICHPIRLGRQYERQGAEWLLGKDGAEQAACLGTKTAENIKRVMDRLYNFLHSAVCGLRPDDLNIIINLYRAYARYQWQQELPELVDPRALPNDTSPFALRRSSHYGMGDKPSCILALGPRCNYMIPGQVENSCLYPSVNEMLSCLSKKQRAIIVMQHIYEMSAKEIGEELGLEEWRVRSVISGAYTKIRNMWERKQKQQAEANPAPNLSGKNRRSSAPLPG